MLHGASTGSPVCAPHRFDAGPLNHLSASKKGALLLVGGPSALWTLELQSKNQDGDECPTFHLERRRNLMQQFRGRGRPQRCTGVCFQPDSDVVAASCSAQGIISLWDTSTNSTDPLIKQWQAHKANESVRALAWLPTSPSGTSQGPGLVSGAGDGTLHLWKLGDLLEKRERSGADEDAPRSEAAADYNVGHHGAVKLVDLRPQKQNRSAVHDLHVSPHGDGAAILASQEDGRACVIRDLAQSVPQYVTVSHQPVVSGRFHPQIPSLFAAATAGKDSALHILEARTKHCVSCLRVGTSFGCVRWRPDHPHQIATTASANECVRGEGLMGAGLLVWDLRRPFLPLHQFNGHGDLMPDFCWADVNHLISCGRDSTVQLHSVTASHQPLTAMRCAGASWAVRPSGNETLAAVGEEVERDAEKDLDRVEALWQLSSSVEHGGFESDSGKKIEGAACEGLIAELRGRKECVRYCDVFARPRTSEAEDDQGIVEILRLAEADTAAGEQEAPSDAVTRCAAQAERCQDAGMFARARTWQLLSEVLSDDVPSESLLAEALNSEGVGEAPAEGGERLEGGRPAHWASQGIPERGPLAMQEDGDRRDQARQRLAVWKEQWRLETLRHVVSFHEERNDVGMLLAMVVTLGAGSPMLGVGTDPDARVRRKVARWVLGAADILSRMRAFAPRAALLRLFPLAETQSIAQRTTQLHLRCAYCPSSRPTPFRPASGLQKDPKDPAKFPGRGTVRFAGGKDGANPAPPECGSCHRRRCPPCAICGDEVRGVFAACQVCGHGGHLHHVRAWFAGGSRMCPAGCGHMCQGPGPGPGAAPAPEAAGQPALAAGPRTLTWP